MKLPDVKYFLREDLKFSLSEIEKAIAFIALGVIAIFMAAIVTFEGEYISGRYFEKFLEYSGVLDQNWMISHQDLFLHEIQVLFIVTFIFEIVFIISKYTRDWKL